MPDEPQYLNALLSLCTAINDSYDLKNVLAALLDKVVNQLHVHAAAFLLYNPQTQTFDYGAGQGFRTRDMERSRLRAGAGVFTRALLEQKPISVLNLKEEKISERTFLIETEDFIGYYSVPLMTQGQTLGLLELFHRAPFVMDPVSVIFLNVLAAEAALAIHHVQLFNDLQKSNQELMLAYETTLEGWVRALDLRDRETSGHTLRTTELSLKLAHAMGLRDEQLMQIRRGALLHDIGKLGISDGILHKPGKLTEEELKLLKQHPVLGYQLLAPIPFLRSALDIVYCHHERWDGSGYPRGLKGEEIPLSARLFAVVDVWDALVADHPYRRGTPKEAAIAYLEGQAGKTLDPQVVKTFLEVIHG